MSDHPELTDNIILLKPHRIEDAEEQLRGEDDEIRKWLNEGHTSTIESVRNWITGSLKSWENDGPVYTFGIWLVKEGNLIGMVEANTDAGVVEGIENGDANISYELYPEFRGKGYMTRAVNLVQEFLALKGLRRAVIRVSPENTNSLNVPPRCGFTNTGEIITKNEVRMVIFVRELQ